MSVNGYDLLSGRGRAAIDHVYMRVINRGGAGSERIAARCVGHGHYVDIHGVHYIK